MVIMLILWAIIVPDLDYLSQGLVQIESQLVDYKITITHKISESDIYNEYGYIKLKISKTAQYSINII